MLNIGNICKVELEYSVLNIQDTLTFYFYVVHEGDIDLGALNVNFCRFFISKFFKNLLSEKFVWQSVKLTLLEKNIDAEGVESLKEVDSYKHTASVLKKISPEYTWGHLNLNLDECIRFCYNRKIPSGSFCFTLYGICNSREYLFNYDFMLKCSDGENWDEEDEEDFESFEDLDGFKGFARTLVTNRSQQSRFYTALGTVF